MRKVRKICQRSIKREKALPPLIYLPFHLIIIKVRRYRRQNFEAQAQTFNSNIDTLTCITGFHYNLVCTS